MRDVPLGRDVVEPSAAVRAWGPVVVLVLLVPLVITTAASAVPTLSTGVSHAASCAHRLSELL